MNKLQEWRTHAYELSVKLCRDYGTQGKMAFKVSAAGDPSIVDGVSSFCVSALV